MLEQKIRKVLVVLGGEREPVILAIDKAAAFIGDKRYAQETLTASCSGLGEDGPQYPNEWQGMIFESIYSLLLAENTISYPDYNLSSQQWDALCANVNRELYLLAIHYSAPWEKILRAVSINAEHRCISFEYSS